MIFELSEVLNYQAKKPLNALQQREVEAKQNFNED